MARRLCLSVFLPPKFFCLQEDLQHEANQGAVPVVSWPSSELGCLTGSCRDEASFLGCLRLFHFWTRYPGTAEAFCGAVLLALWFCASASTLLQEGPGSPVHVEQSALDTTPFSKGRVDCRRLRQRQCDRTPPLSLRTFCAAPLLSCQRLGTSRTQERMDAAIWPSARKYPPNAGPDVRPSVFSCYGVPLRAWDGYPFKRGRPVHRPPGQTCFQDKAQVGTPWTHRFRRAGLRLQSHHAVYLGTAPRRIWVQSLNGRACCAMGVGLRLRPSQLCSLLSCYRRGQAVLGVTAFAL